MSLHRAHSERRRAHAVHSLWARVFLYSPTSKIFWFRSYSTGPIINIDSALSTFHVNHNLSTQTNFLNFTEKVQLLFDQFCPMRSKKVRERSTNFKISDDTKFLIKQKQHAYNQWKLDESESNLLLSKSSTQGVKASSRRDFSDFIVHSTTKYGIWSTLKTINNSNSTNQSDITIDSSLINNYFTTPCFNPEEQIIDSVDSNKKNYYK